MKKNSSYIGNQDLINKIIELCIRINNETKFAAFFNYSGHVGMFSSSIRLSKKKWGVMIFDLAFDTFDRENPNRLIEYIKKLESIL